GSQSSFSEGLLFFVAFCGLYGCFLLFFFAAEHRFPYPQVYSADKGWVTKRKSCGGPRWPKMAMVTKFPCLQHRHLLSKVLGFASGVRMFKSACKFCSFPRFQLLLRMP